MADPRRPQGLVPKPALGISRRRRAQVDAAAAPQVKYALGLLVVFLFLLILWIAWPILSRGG